MSSFRFTKKNLPFTSYSTQMAVWLGKTPSEWKLEKLGSIFAFMSEKVNDKDYEPLSVTYGGVIKQVETAAKTDNGENRKLVKKGDIAINSRSDRKGAAGMAEIDGSMSVIYHDLRSRSKENYTKYYHHLFRSYSFSEEFYRWGIGIVDDLWSTRSNEAKNIQIPVPPITQQQSISNFLDNKLSSLDQIISKKQKLIDLLQEKRAALITHAVTKGLDTNAKMKESGVDWIGKIPETWEIFKIKHLVEINKSSLGEQTAENYEFNYVDIGNVNSQGEILSLQKYTYSKSPSRARRLAHDNDIIISTVRTYLKAMARINDSSNLVFSTGFAVIHPIKISSDQLYWSMQSELFLSQVSAYSTGVGYPCIKENVLSTLAIPLPSVSDQIEINKYLSSKTENIDKTNKILKDQISLLSEYRSSLIYHAVTGKIKV